MSGFAKKSFKLIIWLLVVAILFIAITATIFLTTFDANQYKQDLSDLVKRETGRELEFLGEINATFYPALGMKLGAMSLSNAPGFGAKSMLKVNKASVSVDVASLLLFRPEIDQLLLEDLEINLEKNAKGVTNWDDLLKADTGKSVTATESAQATPSGGPVKIEGAFGGLNIRNARLSWKDVQAGAEYQINDLDLSTGRIMPNAPFTIKLHLTLESADGISAIVDLNSQILFLLNDSRLKISDFDLDLELIGKALPQGQITVGVASQVVVFDLTRNAIKLDGVDLDIDDSRLSGSLKLTDFTQPAVTFNLTSDLLDIDALLGTPSVAEQATVEASGEAGVKTSEDVKISLPMELLRSIKIDGQLTVKQIKMQNLLLQDASLKVTANKGVLNLDPIKMALYQGNFEGRVQVDARKKLPRYRVSKSLKGVQIGELLIDYMGEDRMAGALDASVELQTRGEWVSELKKNSNGAMRLAFTDGALKGFNLRHSIDKAKAKLDKQPEPSEETLKTDFSALALSGKVKNGVFSSNDLTLQAPLLRVSGEGEANLNDDTLDYLVNARLVRSLEGQQEVASDTTKGLLIPVSIKGPFADPEIDVLLDEMLKAQAQEKLKAGIAAEKAALEKQIQAKKDALEAAKQREREKQKQVLEAKKKAELEKAKKKLLQKLID